jgi:hypothetical protein
MLRGGEGGVLTFGEMGDGTTTGGWFTPVRKARPRDLDSARPVREADFGGSSWFAPRPAAEQQPGPGDGFGDGGGLAFPGRGRAAPGEGANFGGPGAGNQGYRDQGLADPGRPAPAFEHWQRQDQDFDGRDDGRDRREPAVGMAWREVPARGVTAANRWAEVTRGGSPAGVNRGRQPADDGFPPSGFTSNRDLPDGDNRAFSAGRGYTADGSLEEPRDGFGGPARDDVPFRGARPIDISASRTPPARRGPGYSAAAASAEPDAAQRRPETGALRRIKESGAMRAIMDTGAMRVLMDTTAMQMFRERYAGRGRALAIAGVCFWVVLAVGATLLILTHGG